MFDYNAKKCRQTPANRDHCEHELSVFEALRGPRSSLLRALRISIDKDSDFSDRDSSSDEDEPEIEENKYIATRRRPVFSCRTDAVFIPEMIQRLYMGKKNGLEVFLKDQITGCKICKNRFSQRVGHAFLFVFLSPSHSAYNCARKHQDIRS